MDGKEEVRMVKASLPDLEPFDPSSAESVDMLLEKSNRDRYAKYIDAEDVQDSEIRQTQDWEICIV
ncbi:MAG: hypothetical protein M4579_006743 [Chaenotheca gracillima]|nr:MAG: hypothetical protein M4579_006743 [Chaenotheca gracillima]